MKDTILITDNRDPLFGLERSEYIRLLQEKLEGRVDQAWLFGSFTGNSFGSDSDIDIILIKETAVPFVERPFEFADLLDLVPSTDILVYTSVEFARLTDDSAVGFWKSVKESMVRLV
ncbi:MAG: nucleotidyltransferase domain-containing protein [Spirochaetota bacterium]